MEKLKVIKIGGNIIDNPTALASFLKDFASLQGHKILIHGGGKIATQLSAKLGIETKMHEGKRITDQETIDVVTMVYGGLINKNIVAKLNAMGTKTMGLTGADAQIVLAKKRPVKVIDYGFVGDVEQVDNLLIKSLMDQKINMVIAPLSVDSFGQILNTNADSMAQAIAVSMSQHFETELIYCFEKNGVLGDANDDNSVISSINPSSYFQLKNDNVVNAGMIPKLDNAFLALQKGVSAVIIGHAKNIANMDKTDYICTKICL